MLKFKVNYKLKVCFIQTYNYSSIPAVLYGTDYSKLSAKKGSYLITIHNQHISIEEFFLNKTQC